MVKITKLIDKSSKHEYEMITVPNTLKEKVGMAKITDEMIAEADKEVKKFERSFENKVYELIDILYNNLKRIKENNDLLLANDDWLEASNTAHVLKGEGGTFGYPLISVIGDSFVKYLDSKKNKKVNYIVMKSIIDAFSTIMKHNLREPNNPIAIEITKTLEKVINKKNN
jgi:HPt (histidine-containing phosphotransfer) domain-containing protein